LISALFSVTQEAQGPSYLDLRTKLQALQLSAGESGQDKYRLAMLLLAAVEQQFPVITSET